MHHTPPGRSADTVRGQAQLPRGLPRRSCPTASTTGTMAPDGCRSGMAISSYSSDRQESVHKRGLRRRQPLVDADRRGLTCSTLGHHPSRKRPGNVEMSRRETTTDRVEKMPSCNRDDSGGQRLEADFMSEVRDRAAQRPLRADAHRHLGSSAGFRVRGGRWGGPGPCRCGGHAGHGRVPP
jgi:hypothetical protein